jgi:hypothetical protein
MWPGHSAGVGPPKVKKIAFVVRHDLARDHRTSLANRLRRGLGVCSGAERLAAVAGKRLGPGRRYELNLVRGLADSDDCPRDAILVELGRVSDTPPGR